MAKAKTRRAPTKKKSRVSVKEGKKPAVSRELATAVIDCVLEESMGKYKRKFAKLQEDFPSFFGFGGGASDNDPALAGFRRFSQRTVSTDLDQMRQDRQYATAVILYHKTPTARYFVDLRTAFLTSGEMQVEAKDKQVSEWIQAFLSDPFTNYDEYRVLMARDSILSGELLQFPHINPETGHVRYANLSPAFIRGRPLPVPGFPHMPDKLRLRKQALVELGVIKPKDADDFESVPQETHIAPSQYKSMDVIRPRMVTDEDTGALVERLDGDIFFAPVYRILTSLRGHSPLLTSADQIDAVDEALFAMIERLYILNLFVWHITFEGYSESKLKQKRREFERQGGFKPGGHWFTNEKGKVEPVSGSFGNADFVTGFDKALNVAAMSFGIPQAWLGLGDLVNRASAQVSETPVMKMLQQGRKTFRNIEKQMIQYHVIQGSLKGMLRGVEDLSFMISYEELSRADQTEAATSFSTLAGALSTAVERQWMDDAQAQRLLTFVAEQIVKLPKSEIRDEKKADPSRSTDDDEDFDDIDVDDRTGGRADAASNSMAQELIDSVKEARKKRKKEKKYAGNGS